MKEVSKEEFTKMLDAIYEHGANPEILHGKCPHCGAPFSYVNGHITGHLPSECQKGHLECSGK